MVCNARNAAAFELNAVWTTPATGRAEGELAVRFELLINEMHEANHKLKDAINHDDRVTRAARRLDNIKEE